MPFVLRVADVPPLNQILEIEQIIIVDKTGPSITVGLGAGASAQVGEWPKGPFAPTEVFSMGDILSTYVGDTGRMDRISQSGVDPAAAGWAQDGSAGAFDGNGYAELKGKTFRRLIIQRVDTDMVADDTAAPQVKAFLKFDVTVAAADTESGKTSRDLVLPAGSRFADDALTAATVIVATSQDILIPKGTALTAGKVTLSSVAAAGVHNLVQDPVTGLLTVSLNTDGTGTPQIAPVVPGSLGPTAFFVKGITAAIAAIDTVIDSTILGAAGATVVDAAGISTVNAAGAASAVDAPGTAGATLAKKLTGLYPASIDKTAPTASPMDQITSVWSARNWAVLVADVATLEALRDQLWTNAKDASAVGRGRMACVSGVPATSGSVTAANTALAAVKALQADFLGIDADRVSINFPYSKIYSTELGRNIIVSPGGYKASMFNTLPEEFQSSVGPPQNSILQVIRDMEDAFVARPLVRADYVSLKSFGVSALQRDLAVGWWFMSGVTAANATTYPTRVADNRRRFADLVQDTLAGLASKYNKQPGTTERIDSLVGEIDAFLSTLLSANNPSAQRIEGYLIDAKSANTPTLTALGIRTIIVKVRMLGDLNQIIFQTEIGPTVEVPVSQAA